MYTLAFDEFHLILFIFLLYNILFKDPVTHPHIKQTM